MTTSGRPPTEAVRALNAFLAARSWDEARPWLRPPSPVVSRWAAHRCLLGASGAHGRGDIAQRDVYAWSAVAILCALDMGDTFDHAVWSEIGAWWSWTCDHRRLRPTPFVLHQYVRADYPQESLAPILGCASEAEAARVLDDHPSLGTLVAAAAVAVAGFHAASVRAPSADLIFLFAAMIVERLPPSAGYDLPIIRLHEDAPELRELLGRAAESMEDIGTGYESDIRAVQAWAAVFAHPDSRGLTSGARVGFLAEAADAVLSLYETSGIPTACDWTVKLAELALAVPDFPAAARNNVETRRARALTARYERLGDDGDLNTAIAIYEGMLDTAEDNEERLIAVNNLALELRTRAIVGTSRLAGDLDRARELLTPYATEILGESGHTPDELDLDVLTNYSLILCSRFALLPDRPEGERLSELYAAVGASQKAVASARTADVRMWTHLRELANTCFQLNGVRPREQDWPSVSRLYEEAWREAARAGPHPELSVAHEWGRSASSRDDWMTADRAFGLALRAFDAVLRSQPARSQNACAALLIRTGRRGRAGQDNACRDDHAARSAARSGLDPGTAPGDAA